MFPVAERLLDSSLQMLRNIPHLAVIPLVILWFGIDEEAKLFLVAAGVLFPIYLNTFHGIRHVDRALIEMARSYGLGPWALFTRVILPGALPSILVGLRYALGIMWLTLIVAETISASAGIGYMTMNAREFLQTDVVLLGIVVYALLGKLADMLTRLLERRCLAWHPAYQTGEVLAMSAALAARRPPPTALRRRPETPAHGLAVRLAGVEKRFGERRGPARDRPRDRGRALRGHRRPLGRRQEHAAAAAGRPGDRDGRRGPARRPSVRRPARGRAHAVPGCAPAALAAACWTMSASPAARAGASAPPRSWPMSAWATAARTGRRCSPAASASASRWPAPWSAGRACSCWTSRSARSTR